jgi:hypothetical protein
MEGALPAHYGWLGFIVPDDELEVSSEDSEGCPVAAAEPGGDELCSFAPFEVSPLAPVEDLFDISLQRAKDDPPVDDVEQPIHRSLHAATVFCGWCLFPPPGLSHSTLRREVDRRRKQLGR